MESPSSDFDESSIDSAILGVLQHEEPPNASRETEVECEQPDHSETLTIAEPKTEAEQKMSVAELFRQKWAAFAATALIVAVFLGNLPAS